MKDLLIRLGLRVRDLRAEKGWSQEEFADVCGFHRTYIGQVERGEKNISFENLTKLAGALGKSLAELVAELENDRSQRSGIRLTRKAQAAADGEYVKRLLEVKNLLRQLKHQKAAMDRTMTALTDVVGTDRGYLVGSKTRSSRKSSQP